MATTAQNLERIQRRNRASFRIPELNCLGDPWDTVYTAKLRRYERRDGQQVERVQVFTVWVQGRIADIIQLRDVSTGEGFGSIAADILEITPTGETRTPQQAGHAQ